MNDLIRRKDVEQMLKDLGGCDASDKEAAGWDKAIDAALYGLEKVDSASVIEEQPKVREWIPSNTPPETNDKVLVTYQKSYKQELLIGFDRYNRYPIHNIERWEGKGIRVMAWMPLPEPWKGENDV